MARFPFTHTVCVTLFGAFAALTMGAGACASGDKIMSTTTSGAGGSGGGVATSPGPGAGTGGETGAGCISNNCKADAECATCSNGYTTCNVSTHRCVACSSSKPCPAGLTCSSFGDCVPEGAT